MADDIKETEDKPTAKRGKVALIEDHRPRWPRPVGIELSEVETTIYGDLLDAVAASRGTSPLTSELLLAGQAAQCKRSLDSTVSSA